MQKEVFTFLKFT